MPRKRATSFDQIKQDFIDTIERLKTGRPQNLRLRERVRKGKSVRLNISTVALEANRARGLIASENCRYPEVRQLVLMEADGLEIEPRSRDDVIKKLRTENAELRAQLSKAEAHAAYHFAQRTKAERRFLDFKGRYERLAARVEKAQPFSSDKVVPLFPEDANDTQ